MRHVRPIRISPTRGVSGDGPVVLLEAVEAPLDESECLCRVGRSGSDGGLLEAEVLVEDEDEEESDDESARLRRVGRSGSEDCELPEPELLDEDESDDPEPPLESRPLK